MKQPAALGARWAPSEQLRSRWQWPLGALMLILGMSWLLLNVGVGLERGGLLVAIIPIGLLSLTFALNRLGVHHNDRVRQLANDAAGIPDRAVTTRAGRALMLLLALGVALGVTSWDSLLSDGHPRAALIVLAASLVGAWGVAVCASAAYRTLGADRVSGPYLLLGLTIGLLVLGASGNQLSVPRIHPRMHYRHVSPGGHPIWATGSRHAPVVVQHSTARVAVHAADLRSRPSIAASVIEQAKYGTQLAVIGRSADWLEVRLPDGQEGWAAAAWVVVTPS